jgi:hypothetical protein
VYITSERPFQYLVDLYYYNELVFIYESNIIIYRTPIHKKLGIKKQIIINIIDTVHNTLCILYLFTLLNIFYYISV